MQTETLQFHDVQLTEFVQLLFQELQAFGIFAAAGKADNSHVEEYIKTRVAIINSIIKFIELGYSEFTQGLTVDEAARPILYNLAYWPEDAPVAGYCTINDKIKYSHLLYTYIGNWTYESKHDASIDSRLLLASLWMWYKHDFKATLKYLFDLQRYGYLIRGLLNIVSLLIRFQALGKGIDEIVTAYFGDNIPVNNADWLNKYPKEPFLTLLELDKELDLTVVQSILGSIAMDTFKEIRQARTLTNPSAWLLEQAAIVLRCRLVLHLFQEFSLTPTIMLKTVLSQFDEISADGGIYWIYRESIHKDFRPLRSPMAVQLGYLPMMFHAKLGDEAEKRLYQDRLVYPEVLRHFVEESLKDENPLRVRQPLEEWFNIPARIVNPFMAALGEIPPLLILRKEMFPLRQIEQIPDMQRFFQVHGIYSELDRKRLLEEFYLGHIPKWLMSEESDAFRPSKEQEKELISLLSSLHQLLCKQELVEKLQSSWQARNMEDRKHLLEQISSFYPWSFSVYQELSIFNDEVQEIQQAWEYILTAMILSLDDPIVWQSFGVILQRVGNVTDARLVLAFSQYLQEQKNT